MHQPPLNSVAIFPTNEKVDNHNNQVLRSSGEPVFFIKALHSGTATEALPARSFEGLQSIVRLCPNASVMLTKNLGVDFGLANGTMGIVKYILCFPEESTELLRENNEQVNFNNAFELNIENSDNMDMVEDFGVIGGFEEEYNGVDQHVNVVSLEIESNIPIEDDHVKDVILVEFAGYTGRVFFLDNPKLVPIFRSSIRKDRGERCQFPLVLCNALTIHKAQGGSYDYVYSDIGEREMSPGVSYVAFTRCRTVENLYLAPFSYERYKDIGAVTTNLVDKLIELNRLVFYEDRRRIQSSSDI